MEPLILMLAFAVAILIWRPEMLKTAFTFVITRAESVYTWLATRVSPQTLAMAVLVLAALAVVLLTF